MLSANSNTGFTALQTSTLDYLFVVSLALLSYDHILTFGLEIRLIWRRPFHTVTVAFLVNRYLSLIVNFARLVAVSKPLTSRVFFLTSSLSRTSNNCIIVVVGTGFPARHAGVITQVQSSRCNIVSATYNSFTLALQFITWGLQLWRVSALYNHKKAFIRAMIPFFLLCVGISLWSLTIGLSRPVIYQYGCIPAHNNLSPSGKSYLVSVLMWELSMVSLTVRKTWKMARISRDLYGKPFLSTIMFRDGLIYFLTIALFYLLNIVTYFTSNPSFFPGSFFWLSSSILIAMSSRIVLNLRENMDAAIVSGDEEHNTVDIIMTDIIFQQLENPDWDA